MRSPSAFHARVSGEQAAAAARVRAHLLKLPPPCVAALAACDAAGSARCARVKKERV
jgi:hypothetical protein